MLVQGWSILPDWEEEGKRDVDYAICSGFVFYFWEAVS